MLGVILVQGDPDESSPSKHQNKSLIGTVTKEFSFIDATGLPGFTIVN